MWKTGIKPCNASLFCPHGVVDRVGGLSTAFLSKTGIISLPKEMHRKFFHIPQHLWKKGEAYTLLLILAVMSRILSCRGELGSLS